MNSPPSDEAVSGLIFDVERVSGEVATRFTGNGPNGLFSKKETTQGLVGCMRIHEDAEIAPAGAQPIMSVRDWVAVT